MIALQSLQKFNVLDAGLGNTRGVSIVKYGRVTAESVARRSFNRCGVGKICQPDLRCKICGATHELEYFSGQEPLRRPA